DVRTQFHRVSSLGVEQVVISLPGSIIEFERSSRDESSRRAGERPETDRTCRFSGYETVGGILRQRIDGCGSRRRLHIINVETEARGIEQLGREDVIVLDGKDVA